MVAEGEDGVVLSGGREESVKDRKKDWEIEIGATYENCGPLPFWPWR